MLLVYAWVTVGLLAAYAGMWVLSFITVGYTDPAPFAETAWRGIRPWLPWGLYPLFLIIWFLWPRIRAQVREW